MKMFMILLAALCAVASISGAEETASAEVDAKSNFMMRRRNDDFRRRRYNRYNRDYDDDDDDDDDDRDYRRSYRRNYRRDYDDDKMSAVSFSSGSEEAPATVYSTSEEAYLGNNFNRRRDYRSRRNSRGVWGRRMRDRRQRRYGNRDSRRYRNRDSRRYNRRSRSYRRYDDDRRGSRRDRDYERDDKV